MFQFLRRFSRPSGLFRLCRPLLPLPRRSFAVVVVATTSTSTATVRLSWWRLRWGIWSRNRAYALAALSLFLERRDVSGGVGAMLAVSRCINCVAVRDGTVGKHLSCKNYLSNLFFLPILLILGWHMNTMMFCRTNLFLRYIYHSKKDWYCHHLTFTTNINITGDFDSCMDNLLILMHG